MGKLRKLSVLALCLGLSSTMAFSQDDDWDMGDWGEEEEAKAYQITGFIEGALGTRLSSDPVIDSEGTLRDLRAQIQVDYDLAASRLQFSADAYYDGVLQQSKLQVREAFWQGNLDSVGDWGKNFDVKIGQQILTWGTGDYIFLNDMFPKDYQSFFSGRDDEYLKAPSLSAKISGFFDWANVDFVVTPKFTPDNYINGDYFSFFSPMAGQNIAPGFDVKSPLKPDSPEYAIRIYKSVGPTEYAAYFYDGFHKSPNSATPLGEPTFSELQVVGASMITTLGPGLFNAEFALYDSKEDSEGTNPLIPNSQQRWLIGYKQELAKNFTGSVQWYLERNDDYDALIANSPAPQFEIGRSRIWITQRLMYRALQQTLTLSGFNFFSTTDQDGYFKFSADYSPTDDWRLSGGFNIFYGDEPFTFFNQFEDASNVFVRYRYFY
ncbi:hypothetical protein [Glaciecola sp. 1036]|uniref:hypothetical protein n=1 Tax=Alteromonadaceae TaxID=72275 RepID=UPI003CFBF7E3